MKRYSLNIGAGKGKIGARSIRERVFKINTRKIMETQQKQLDRVALRGDSFNAIHNREAYSALCRKELRPDLFNGDDPCTVATSDKFNMEHNCKLHEETTVGAEQKVTKFFQTPVEIDEARTMSRAQLNHRVQELRNLHGQEWILATGQEWLESLPNVRKQEPYDFLLRALIEQLMNSGRRTISISELNMKKRIVFDSEIAGFAAMGTRQVTNHVKLASVLQTTRRQIRRKGEIYMQWTPGHSKHLGNEMADGLPFLGSKKTSFSPVWMKTALRKLHKRAVEMDTKEPTQEFTPQHRGWSGYRDILITAAEKVIDRGKQPVVGLPYSTEALREIQRRRVEYWIKN